MRIVIQRVKRAKVTVSGETVGEIGNGLLLLVGVHRDDVEVEQTIKKFGKKCLTMRLWSNMVKTEAGDDPNTPE